MLELCFKHWRCLTVPKMEKVVTYTSVTPSSCSAKISHAHDIINLPEYSLIANRIQSCKSVREIKQIHAFMIKAKTQTKTETKKPLPTQIMCTKIMSLVQHQQEQDFVGTYICSLVKQWDHPDMFVINAIIQALSTCKNKNKKNYFYYPMLLLRVTLELYGEILKKGLSPNSYTVPYVLKACSESQALREGQQLHSYSLKTGLVSNVYVKNTLMRLYAACGIVKAVHNVFEEGPHRDLVSWTTIIQAYIKTGYPREAVSAFFQMCETEENLIPDGKMFVVVLSACSRLGDLTLGRKIHEYMHRHCISVDSDVFLGNALVDMYLKCGQADMARQVFHEMPVKNVVSWNSMISGLAQQGQFKDALNVFRKMQGMGLKPDDVTLVGVLNSCANLGLLQLGKWVHAYIDKNCIPADGFIGNALVDMYGKCGSIDQALRVFQAMKCTDVYSYTAMIVGLAMHGEAERALDFFSEMRGLGIQPDEVTFVGVLSACSHAGLVEEGWKHFEDMSSVYNLEPQTEHYGCMVDLLGRAGLTREAEQFIKKMPIPPDVFVWGALLGACKIHAKVELGESVMEKLIKMEPSKDGAYVLMSNIYSSANRWRDSLKWRKAMEETKMKKTPGCSSVEVNGVVHEFRKGEKSHPKCKELCKLLEEMAGHLRNYGTLPKSVGYVHPASYG